MPFWQFAIALSNRFEVINLNIRISLPVPTYIPSLLTTLDVKNLKKAHRKCRGDFHIGRVLMHSMDKGSTTSGKLDTADLTYKEGWDARCDQWSTFPRGAATQGRNIAPPSPARSSVCCWESRRSPLGAYEAHSASRTLLFCRHISWAFSSTPHQRCARIRIRLCITSASIIMHTSCR